MNSNMRLFLELVANSAGMKRELTDSGRAVHKFTQGAKREFESLKRAVGSVQGQLAGIGLTVGAVQQMMQSAQLDKSLIQIGQTAGVGAGEVASLRSGLFRMGKESGQVIENLKGGFDALVQSGLNMREAKATLDGINVAMAVTGANATTLSGGLTVAAQAFQFDLDKPGQALELLDKMTVAGRLGNAELENLSSIFARVGVNANSAGMSFDKTLGFIEALSKVERQPERLATLADSTLRVFTNLNYMRAAQKATGVNFYGKDGSRRDPLAVLKDIKAKFDGLKTDVQRDSFVGAAFGKADLDTIKGIRTLLGSNNLNEVGRMTGLIKDASGTLKKDFKEATANLIDQGGRLKNTLREAADGFVQPINKATADFLKRVMDDKKSGGMGVTGKEMLAGGAAVAAASVLAYRYGGKAISSLVRGAGGVAMGVAEGKALQAAAGITPVFVTNWPTSLGGSGVADTIGGIAGGAAAGNGGRAAGWIARNWKLMAGSSMGMASAELLPFLLAGGAGYGAGTLMNYGLGGLSGWATGGKYSGSGWMGEQVYDMFHPETYRPGAGKTDINLELNIDALGRLTSRSNNLNTSINTVRRGNFFSALMTTEGY